jgi:hypothetical protein
MNTIRILTLVRFVSERSRDFASHWMQRQLRRDAVSQIFKHVLKDDFLVRGRGGHSVYIVDEGTALRFVGLLPREWKLFRETHYTHPDILEEERCKIILEAYKAQFGDVMSKEGSRLGKRKDMEITSGGRKKRESSSSNPPKKRQRTVASNEGHVLAEYKEGKGVEVACVKKGCLEKRMDKMKQGQLLSSFECKNTKFMKEYIDKILREKHVSHKQNKREFFDVSKGEVSRLFKVMVFVRTCLNSRKEKKPGLFEESEIMDEDLMASVFEDELEAGRDPWCF